MWGERPTITSEAARPPTNPSVAPNGAPRIILRSLSHAGGRCGLTLGYIHVSPTGTKLSWLRRSRTFVARENHGRSRRRLGRRQGLVPYGGSLHSDSCIRGYPGKPQFPVCAVCVETCILCGLCIFIHLVRFDTFCEICPYPRLEKGI